MFERVYPATRPPRAIPVPALISLAVHTAFVAVVGISLPVYMRETVADGIQYFAPLPVRQQQVSGERLSFLEFGGVADIGPVAGAGEAFADGPAIGSRGLEVADS